MNLLIFEVLKYIITAAMCGTIANSFKKRWCFVIWSITNAFWCGYFFIGGDYAPFMLYLFNFAISVIGFVRWKEKAMQAEEAMQFVGYLQQGKCPKCKAEINNIISRDDSGKESYCPCCGQLISWEVKNAE